MELVQNVFTITLLISWFHLSRGQIDNIDNVQAAAGAVWALPGGTAQLPCGVRPDVYGNKLNVLTWYTDKSTKSIYSRDYRHETPPSTSRSDDRYRFAQLEENSSVLVIHPVQKEDGGVYRCHVDFATSRSHDTYVHLMIVEKPSHMVILGSNGSKVGGGAAGPYREGEELLLVCVVFGGDPLPNVTWWRGPELLDDSWTQFSLRRVRNELSLGRLQRQHYGMVLTCRASNNEDGEPLASDVSVDMYLKPTHVAMYASEEPARAGPFQLQCQIFGARPAPTFLWIKDGLQLDVEQSVVSEPSGRGDLSTITISAAAQDDGKNISCCTEKRAKKLSLMCSEPLALKVYYVPIVRVTLDNEILNETSVIVGSNVTLMCNITANPWIFNFIWYFNNDVIRTSNDAELDSLCPALTLESVTEERSGDYRCSATNKEGIGMSQKLHVDVQFSPRCIETSPVEYGLAIDGATNLTCNVSGNPAPAIYRWVFVNTTLRAQAGAPAAADDCRLLDVTQDPVYEHTVTNEDGYGTILCWGQNDVTNTSSALTDEACVFTITDLSAPHQPTDCVAIRTLNNDITVNCVKGHDGGLPQKFTLTIVSQESGEEILSVSALEPHLTAPEPADTSYAIVVVAHNEKGTTEPIRLTKDDVSDEIIDAGITRGAIADISTLVLYLAGGVGVLVLVACALVMGARELRSDAGSDGVQTSKSHRRRQSGNCPYVTDESNCDTCQESEGGSQSSLRRTDSFKRAVSSKYQPKSNTMHRANSFRSSRWMTDTGPCENLLRHSNSCRVHSLQNICGTLNRRKECDALCDHLLLHLPVDLPNYSIPKPPVPFYTMPRNHHKVAKAQNNSETAQHFDSLPLPPPPEDFHTFRSASDILAKECPATTAASANYMNVASKGNESDGNARQYNNVIISPMNTVGLPSAWATHALGSARSCPDDEPQSVCNSTKAGPSYTQYNDGHF